MSDKLCFVIGPMRDMARLNKFAYEVIRPLVQDKGYRVETPDRPDVGNIMDQVIATLDRAELVIADLTGYTAYLSGSEIDFVENDMMGAGFSIKNPNVKSSCGCGHSHSF